MWRLWVAGVRVTHSVAIKLKLQPYVRFYSVLGAIRLITKGAYYKKNRPSVCCGDYGCNIRVERFVYNDIKDNFKIVGWSQ